jgi:hypothetical protein
MGNDVFANGREISCKAADGKAICAFPDVCFTPPQTPATPPGVPIPYPNTGMASDATNGSKKVKISNKEVMLKNKSYFKKSTGDEAGSAPKKGVITSKIQGKVYFNAWSMDVKFEGENVVRHLDLTTHNHGSTPGNSPPWAYTDSMTAAQLNDCEKDIEREQEACGYDKEKKEYMKTAEQCCEDEKCQEARKCMLVPYGGSGSPNCCGDKVGHHLVEGHCFVSTSEKAPLEDLEAYDYNGAPTVCASGSRYDAEHGMMHAVQSSVEAAFTDKPVNCEWLDAGKKVKDQKERDTAKSQWKYKDARKAGVEAHKAAFPGQCNEDCIKNQIDAYHKNECGFDDETPLRTDPIKRKGKELKGDEIRRHTEAVNNALGVKQRRSV